MRKTEAGAVAKPVQTSGGLKFGGEMFDFRRATVFLFGTPLLKAQNDDCIACQRLIYRTSVGEFLHTGKSNLGGKKFLARCWKPNLAEKQLLRSKRPI